MFNDTVFCKRCGHYVGATDRCNCREFQVYNPDTMDEDTPKLIWAYTKDEAAKKYVEHEYYDDPCDVDDFEMEFFVNGVRFNASARQTIEFEIDEV
jgi:hypothetical protein